MEKMDVAKDPVVKMRGEDLAHAYDAVRVANKSVWPSSALCCFPANSYAVIYLYVYEGLTFHLSLYLSGFLRVSCVNSAVRGRRSWRLCGVS